MDTQKRLQVAIAKAKAGHELSARDLFVEIVRSEPDNKLAWLWLIGLLDDPDALIHACENVLRLDPDDERVRRRLNELLAKKSAQYAQQVGERMREAQRFFADEQPEYALLRLREVLEIDPKNEKAWGLIAKYSIDLDEQVHALGELAALDPKNETKRSLFERWTYYQTHPLDLAAFYEERGKWEMAIGVYKKMAAGAKDRRDWDRIVNEISRLEYIQQEKIVHVSPMLSLIRLTAGMPLLFLFLLIIHIGYNFSYFTFAMGLELLTVLGGSFLVALAAVGAEHALWRRLGNAVGRATKSLRLGVGAAGFVVMLLPFLLLSFDAFQRWMEGVHW